jgi:hypothetical protein
MSWQQMRLKYVRPLKKVNWSDEFLRERRQALIRAVISGEIRVTK